MYRVSIQNIYVGKIRLFPFLESYIMTFKQSSWAKIIFFLYNTSLNSYLLTNNSQTFYKNI